MSFGEFMFLAGFIQKTTKEDPKYQKRPRDNFVATMQECS
jgi:hypothetical protein